jgi:uncharacterized protein YukE
MPRIAVEPTSLTAAARRLTGSAQQLQSIAGAFGGKVSGIGAASGSPDVEAAAQALQTAWSGALRDVAASVSGFARNTDAAAVVYEAADRLPGPPPPPPPPKPSHSDPLLPWLDPANDPNLRA